MLLVCAVLIMAVSILLGMVQLANIVVRIVGLAGGGTMNKFDIEYQEFNQPENRKRVSVVDLLTSSKMGLFTSIVLVAISGKLTTFDLSIIEKIFTGGMGMLGILGIVMFYLVIRKEAKKCQQ